MKKCKDCGENIQRVSQRCMKCAIKFRNENFPIVGPGGVSKFIKSTKYGNLRKDDYGKYYVDEKRVQKTLCKCGKLKNRLSKKCWDCYTKKLKK